MLDSPPWSFFFETDYKDEHVDTRWRGKAAHHSPTVRRGEKFIKDGAKIAQLPCLSLVEQPLEIPAWMEPTPSILSSCSQKSLETWRMSTLLGKEVSWILEHGWKNTSAQWKRLAPTVVMFPFGSSQDSLLKLGCATREHDMTYKTLRMSMLHFMKQRKEVSWFPLAPSPVKLG